jgi:hypothetical protein
MGLPVGTNCLTKAEDAIRLMLASTTKFQSWVNAIDATQALERVYIDEFEWPDKSVGEEYPADEWATWFPHAIVEPPPDGDSIRIVHYAIGSQWEYHPSYSFIVRFERYRNPEVCNQDDLRDFKNEVGGIVEAMTDIAHEHFAFTLANPADRPARGEYAEFAELGTVFTWPWLLLKEIG